MGVCKLNQKLCEVFQNEVTKLQIGYDFNKQSISDMMDILHAISVLNSTPPRELSIKILRMYE